MGPRRSHRYCRCNGHEYLFSSSSLIFTAFLSGISNAQNAPQNSPSLVSVSTMSLTVLSSAVPPPTSLRTSFTTSSASNTTTSSSHRPTGTNDAPPQLGIQPAGGTSSENVFNYYFLFLALFGALIAIGLWWIHKRRKRQKERMRLSGQNALAQDLDGWVNTRRWMHGRWRQNQTGPIRREEGLDENGEAPPPYQPNSDITVGQHDTTPAHDAASGLAIPLRTLSRDEIERIRPPEYREADSHANATSA